MCREYKLAWCSTTVKFYSGYHPHLATRHVKKFYKATPRGSKDLAVNTLKFKLILDSPLKKIVREIPVSGRLCANKTWSF